MSVHTAELARPEWPRVRDIFLSGLGLGPVDWGDDALGLQYDDAPSPHAKNVNVVFDGTQVEVELWGGSETQRKRVLEGSVAQAKALGIVLVWKD
jgi:hypothetical protein